MKCPANADCELETKVITICADVRVRPTRKEIYIVIGICTIALFGFLGYNWLAVGGCAEKSDVKEIKESVHRQELAVARMEVIVQTLVSSHDDEVIRSKKEDEASKIERRNNDMRIRDNERRLDRIVE